MPGFIPIEGRKARASANTALNDGRIAALDLTRTAPTVLKIYRLEPIPETRNKAKFVYRYKGEERPKRANLIATYKWISGSWVKQ